MANGHWRSTANLLRSGLALLSLSLASCSSPSFIPPQPAPEQKSRPAPPDLAILASPHDLREDYVYPPDGTRQVIKWENEHVSWTLRFSSRRYSYGAIVFSHEYDFAKAKPDTILSFRIKPAYMANYLTVGLVDGDVTPSHVMVDIPLVQGPAVMEDGWKTFRIPLSDFGEFGFPVTTGDGPDAADRAPFDWSDVHELRFSTYGRMPRDDIVVTDIHMKR